MRSEVPDGWQLRPLAELITLNPDTVRGWDPDTEIRYIDISAVSVEEGIAPELDRMKLADAPSRAKRVVESGDVLVSMVRPERRSFARVGAELDGAVASTGFSVLRALPGRIDPKFLWGAIRDHRFVQSLVARQTGSNYPAVRPTDIADYVVAVPTLAEQLRIAWILGSLDDKIELNRRMVETLEQIAAVLFKARLVDFIGVEEFEESEIGRVPKGWQVGTVSDLCIRIGNGGTPRRMEPRYWDGGTIPWFKTGELTDSILSSPSDEQITQAGLDESSCKLFPAGTVLIAIYAAPTVGRLGVLSEPASSNQACSALEPRDEVGTWFLFYTLRHLRSYLNGIASGSAQQNISKKIVESAPCVVPPTDELSRFDELAAPIAEKVTALNSERMVLASLRDTLLPKLISGAIRVPEGFGPESDPSGLVEAGSPAPATASGDDRTGTSTTAAA